MTKKKEKEENEKEIETKETETTEEQEEETNTDQLSVIDNLANGNVDDAKRGISDIIQKSIQNFVMSGEELEDKPDLPIPSKTEEEGEEDDKTE